MFKIPIIIYFLYINKVFLLGVRCVSYIKIECYYLIGDVFTEYILGKMKIRAKRMIYSFFDLKQRIQCCYFLLKLIVFFVRGKCIF